MELDSSTRFGARVAERLRDDLIAWLVTVRADGTPQPSPIWFLWDGEGFLVCSQPRTQKLRNLASNHRVALHLDSDGRGGDIAIFTGEARVLAEEPPAALMDDFAAKYHELFRRLPGGDRKSFEASYSVRLWITPTALRGH